ncbi:adenylosuccinate synthase [soil metagenome]
MTVRKNSFAFCGGAFGDEGKGRIIDEVVNNATENGEHIYIYRDNGGANAGHTVEFSNGQRVALHQLLSGVFTKKATMILGKGMVIHPGDLLTEMSQVKEATVGTIPAKLFIDEMTVLSLDTHRAFEGMLKQWEEGGKGSTGRGISPAYADVLLRHPLRMRDIKNFDQKKIEKHYNLYAALVKGLGGELATAEVATLAGEKIPVGSLETFVSRVKSQAADLESYIQDVTQVMEKGWSDPKTTFIFEKAQAIGLDWRWGVYPDVTASDCTIDGIFASSEGVVDPDMIGIRAGVIKATYMSSVGSRVLPTTMEETLANKIREDAHEYGATTKRPRGIAYIDIPALQFYAKVGRLTHMVLTHMDMVYDETPIKVCTHYTVNNKSVAYRPDQEFLNTVEAHYVEFETWSQKEIQHAKNKKELPTAAVKYIEFLENQLGVKVWMMTTGPQRDQSIWY